MSEISDRVREALDGEVWFLACQRTREMELRKLCDACDGFESAADRFGMNLLMNHPVTEYPELKPCPFCGSLAEIKRREPQLIRGEYIKGAYTYELHIDVAIQCSKCGMANAFGGRTAVIELDGETMAPMTSLYRDPNLLRLVDHWNRRSDND